MSMLRILLLKDLQRVWRRPASILIQIGISLLIVTMIGLAFGGRGGDKGSGMAPIKMVIVDEDESVLSEFLEGSASNPEMAKHFDIHFLERDEALALIDDGGLSAVLIFPKGMSDHYLGDGDERLTIELIKNPAQSVYPAIVEEGVEALVTVLNAVSRNFRDDLIELGDSLEGRLEEEAFFSNTLILTALAADAMDRLKGLEEYLNPPLVWFESTTREEVKDEGETGETFNLFAYLYAGLGCTFLLMIANGVTVDIYREGRMGTLRRFTSMHEGVLIFVAEKSFLVLIVTLITAVVMFGGSSLIFGFRWQSPLPLSVLIVCFAVCCAGLTSLIASIAGKEKRADNLGVIIVMAISILGGGMVQVEALPDIVREGIAPYLPTAWFISPVRAMQTGVTDVEWIGSAMKLVSVGVACVLVSSSIFHRRLQKNGGVG